MTTQTTTQTTGRQYTNVTEAEFDAFMDDLAVYSKRVPANAKEVVYDIPLPVDGLVVRVWSTLVRGNSRAKGEDAIRTVVWDTEKSQPIAGKPKTLRIDTWRKNLRAKIKELLKKWRQYDRLCPECGSRMALREPEQGDSWTAFWGCTNFPRCEHSEDRDAE